MADSSKDGPPIWTNPGLTDRGDSFVVQRSTDGGKTWEEARADWHAHAPTPPPRKRGDMIANVAAAVFVILIAAIALGLLVGSAIAVWEWAL